MRKIKFRAWVQTCETMFDEIFNITLGETIISFHDNETEACFHVHPDYFMQYTGLKDENGKEIYESDIVTFGGVTFVYEWNCNGLWMCKRISDNFKVTIDYWDCEVIGNIYENPELLNNTPPIKEE